MEKFYGQLEQDKFIYDRYFKNYSKGISIECGAFDGVMESSTYFFEETLGWVTINIEASPPIFNMLETNRKNSININKGLSDQNDMLIFEHAIHPNHGVKFGNGSFNHKTSHRQILVSENCKFEKHEAETTTYKELIDTLMEDKFPKQEVDLFVLDVEGFEIETIKGMVGSKYLPKIMCVEYPHVGLENIKNLLTNMDYKFDILKDNNAYFIKNDTNI